MSKRLTIEEVKEKLFKAHGDTVSLVEASYVTTQHSAIFVDKDYGQWKAMVYDIIYNKKNCPQRATKNRKQTCLNRYGVENPMQNVQIKNKLKDSTFKKYGVENVAGLEQTISKRKQTNLEKYGFEYSQQNKEVQEKVRKTCLKRYGFDAPCKNLGIALKGAKKLNNARIFQHWKTGEELVCQASYEQNVVRYLNNNKIDFDWQIPFNMPDGRRYFVDLHLKEQSLWVEIKGWFRGDAKEKWDWFHETYPNSELWDTQKLKGMKII